MGPLMRTALGQTLRELRLEKQMTLRQVSMKARMSLGYLSEIERGHKECSSELLAPLCDALGTPVSVVLHRTSLLVARMEHQSPDPGRRAA